MKTLDSEAAAIIADVHAQISQIVVKRFSQMNLASELQRQRSNYELLLFFSL
jgi:hypothetical protein